MGKIIELKRGEDMGNKESKYRLLKYILYFTNNNDEVYKTKLNKLLFYMQFLYYKKHEIKLINEEFICDHYGPNLNKLTENLEDFERKRWIEIKKTPFGKIIIPKIMLNEQEYSIEEVEVLEEISNKFEKYTPKQISEYSHKESIWDPQYIKNVIPIERAIELGDLQ